MAKSSTRKLCDLFFQLSTWTMLFVRPVHTCSSGPVSTTGARRLHWGFIFDSSELTNALRQSFTKVKVLSPTKLSSLEKPIEAEDNFLCWKVALLPKQTFFPVTGRPENMAYFPCMVLCSFPASEPGKQQRDLALLCSRTKSPLSCHFVLLPDAPEPLSWALKDQRAVAGFVC